MIYALYSVLSIMYCVIIRKCFHWVWFKHCSKVNFCGLKKIIVTWHVKLTKLTLIFSRENQISILNISRIASQWVFLEIYALSILLSFLILLVKLFTTYSLLSMSTWQQIIWYWFEFYKHHKIIQSTNYRQLRILLEYCEIT